MMLRDAENIYIIKVEELLNCRADGGYTRFFLEDGREILTSINLKEYKKMLAKWGLFALIISTSSTTTLDLIRQPAVHSSYPMEKKY